MTLTRHPELEQSKTVEQLPMACANERAAVEFIEAQRWPDGPACVHCGSIDVYKMTDTKTGQRSKRFLWRCYDCKRQYTVRIGTVYEDSRIPLRHWCYAFWRMATSKKGVAAREIQRQTQLSYKSSLFLLQRVRFALSPDPTTVPKLQGTIEADETYVGGKPRRGDGKVHKRGRGTSKIPVFCVVERGGNVHRRVVADVTAATLKDAIREQVDSNARIMTDENKAYTGIGAEFKGGHETVCHSAHEYARGDVNTNTAESSFALVKRGLIGIYHNVSKKHLHRYLAEYDFRWNVRKMNDGDRTTLAIQKADGKRLMYREPIAG